MTTLKIHADRLAIAPRTIEQVRASLANAKRQGCDVAVANLILAHGRVTDDAAKWLREYVA